MGSNTSGALGIGKAEIAHIFYPNLVASLSNQKAVKVSSGGGHTLALMESGDVYAWGLNDQGQLGLNSKENQYLPQKIQKFKGDINRIIDLDAGYNHSFLISSQFSLFSFGGNSFGQLGLGSKLKQLIPTLLAPLPEKPVKLSCGFNFTLILTESGEIYACGDNSCGQLGLGKAMLSSPVPIQVKTGNDVEPFIHISAGKHSAAISNTGILYLWGMSLIQNSYEPQPVEIQRRFKEISVGGDFGVGISTDGKIYTWGRNENGELGLGDYNGRMEMEENKYFVGKKVLKISCGENHVMAIGDNIMDYGSPSVLSISMENDEEGLIEINEILTPSKTVIPKKDVSGGSMVRKSRQNVEKEKENNVQEMKKNFESRRKELNEISVNEIYNTNREKDEVIEQFISRKVPEKDSCQCAEVKRMNEILTRNIGNLNETLKAYLDEDSKFYLKDMNFERQETPIKQVNHKSLELEEKIKDLMICLSEREEDVANFQLELSKKEALQQALLYKIRFLEESLVEKEKEIQCLKNKLG